MYTSRVLFCSSCCIEHKGVISYRNRDRMKEIKYFLAKNLLYLIDSRASCIRVENVHMGNSVRRINMGRDALLGHKQAVRVARWLDVATPVTRWGLDSSPWSWKGPHQRWARLELALPRGIPLDAGERGRACPVSLIIILPKNNNQMCTSIYTQHLLDELFWRHTNIMVEPMTRGTHFSPIL